jgi:hypothetical protein
VRCGYISAGEVRALSRVLPKALALRCMRLSRIPLDLFTLTAGEILCSSLSAPAFPR